MKLHIDRFIYLLKFLKNHAYLSKSGYSAIENPTLIQNKQERYDIKDNHPDFDEYIEKVPKSLNDNIIYIYKLIGDHTKELYIDDWCFLPLKDAVNRYQYYKSQNQTLVFDIAYKYIGLGHITVLSCDLQNHLLFYRNDGGSSDNDREYNLQQVLNYKRDYETNKYCTKRRKINSRNETPYTYMMFQDFANQISR